MRFKFGMLDPCVEILDDRFLSLVLPHARMETLHTGTRWAEGPAWFGAGQYLVWSDIPEDHVLRWDATDGSVSVFSRGGHHNGHTLDREGRLVSCEHSARCVSCIDHDGSRTVLASHWEGKRLNSPNDVAVSSDGAVWFTDPTYGIDGPYEGVPARSEIGASHLYRLAPDGPLEIAADDLVQPNGFAFSPDGTSLYVAVTGGTHVEGGPRHIRRFAVGTDGSLSDGAVWAECSNGFFDGFRVDRDGNVWTSAGDGVHCLAPNGTLLGRIRTDETVANVEFGDRHRSRLFICATTTLYAIYLATRGCMHGGRA